MTAPVVVVRRTGVLRKCTYAYVALCLALIATSAYTGHRATKLSGDEHYMLTTTSIFVPEDLEATNETDAAFDAAFGEADESTAMTVAKPMFVLGFLDATAPAIVLGGALLGMVSWLSRRRSRAASFDFAGKN
jgi:hypothetical protein